MVQRGRKDRRQESPGKGGGFCRAPFFACSPETLARGLRISNPNMFALSADRNREMSEIDMISIRKKQADARVPPADALGDPATTAAGPAEMHALAACEEERATCR
jgi:hypothetical protein